MKKRLIYFFLNPLIISLIIALVVISVLPNFFPKYSIYLVDQQVLRSEKTKVHFADINNDGKPERISAQNNTEGFASFIVRRINTEVIDQWNFDTKFSKNTGNLSIFDINKNNHKEIYTVTTSEDSIFLNVIEPFNTKNFLTRKVFIDSMALYNGNRTILTVTDFHLSKLNDKEVYFSINAGYSGYPRNLYKYNFNTNKILKSPHLTNTYTPKEILQIGDKEFIFYNSYAAQNNIDTIFTKRTDYSSWLSILNQDLKFEFEPIEFKNPYTVFWTYSYKYKNENGVLILANSSNDEKYKDKIAVYSLKGNLLKEIILPDGNYFLRINKNSNKIVLADSNSGIVRIYSKQLVFQKEIKFNGFYDLFQYDIDKNGTIEWLVRNKLNAPLIEIYDENFKNKVSFELNNDSISSINFGIIQNHQSNIYIQKNNEVFLYRYSKNSWYFLKFLSYPLIFMLVYFILWLGIKGQKIQAEKQRTIENEITQLQLKTVNNQLNPHFVFNSINTISEMILTENKLEADDFICRFADLMRETLQKSDKIVTTLQEELDYVENFIRLQQIRFQYQFRYKLTISDNVDSSIKVPKHFIYSFVENAIKHGLATKKGGILTISISNGKHLKICIEDNGGGLGTSTASFKNSTGKGFNIMKDLFDLYNKLYKKKITSEVSNKVNDKGEVVGVRVEILI